MDAGDTLPRTMKYCFRGCALISIQIFAYFLFSRGHIFLELCDVIRRTMGDSWNCGRIFFQLCACFHGTVGGFSRNCGRLFSELFASFLVTVGLFSLNCGLVFLDLWDIILGAVG